MVVRISKIPLAQFKGDLEKSTSDVFKLLMVLALVAIGSQSFFHVALGIKAALIFAVSILVARETEIFFLSQKNSVDRAEAKEVLKTSKPEITGLIYALLLPIGTPLFVVAAGAFVAIFIGKMVFGGYSFNVFNPAIVGRLFVGLSWPLLSTITFPQVFDNYLLQYMFSQDFSTGMLSPLMTLQANGIVTLQGAPSLMKLLFNGQYGMLFAIPSIVYILLIGHFLVRKTADLRPLLFTAGASAITLLVITLSFDLPISYIGLNLLAGGFFFVALFMMTDPFTKPFSTTGILYYAVIFTAVFTLIRFLGKDADGTLYALLFANLFVPLLNKKTISSTFGVSFKSALTVLILLATLIGTGLFISTILHQRIEAQEIVVVEHVQN